MPVVALDHYTIGTANLDRAVAFYEGAIGLKRGPRPAFDFPGAWMYAGERPIVHLFTEDGAAPARTGAFDHIAFTANGIDETRKRLDALGIGYRHQGVPGTGMQQLFLTDPDGIRIELNFANG
jgi:catechol 2,3-dioxygenase-like lactoylglutathione lyase family enzyme